MEIKFRAWSVSEKRMYYVTYGKGCLHTNGSWWAVEDDTETYKASSVTKDILMQYTGLKDKNGVEIYKDDKLRITDEFGQESIHTVVYFADEDYPAYDLEPQLNCDSNGLSHAMACCEIEVIGNIHKEVSQ